MIKILYLLDGILLKQTIDEIKSLWQWRIDFLKEQLAVLKNREPNRALLEGSPEAYRAIIAQQREEQDAPARAKINRQIRILRVLPAVLLALATVLLTLLICYLESKQQQ